MFNFFQPAEERHLLVGSGRMAFVRICHSSVWWSAFKWHYCLLKLCWNFGSLLMMVIFFRLGVIIGSRVMGPVGCGAAQRQGLSRKVGHKQSGGAEVCF